MRRALTYLSFIVICFVAKSAFAQVSGVNGFRTVAEENALMEKTLAERRKQEKLEDHPYHYDQDDDKPKPKPASKPLWHHPVKKAVRPRAAITKKTKRR